MEKIMQNYKSETRIQKMVGKKIQDLNRFSYLVAMGYCFIIPNSSKKRG